MFPGADANWQGWICTGNGIRAQHRVAVHRLPAEIGLWMFLAVKSRLQCLRRAVVGIRLFFFFSRKQSNSVLGARRQQCASRHTCIYEHRGSPKSWPFSPQARGEQEEARAGPAPCPRSVPPHRRALLSQGKHSHARGFPPFSPTHQSVSKDVLGYECLCGQCSSKDTGKEDRVVTEPLHFLLQGRELLQQLCTHRVPKGIF